MDSDREMEDSEEPEAVGIRALEREDLEIKDTTQEDTQE